MIDKFAASLSAFANFFFPILKGDSNTRIISPTVTSLHSAFNEQHVKLNDKYVFPMFINFVRRMVRIQRIKREQCGSLKENRNYKETGTYNVKETAVISIMQR